ncbi:MAG: hypothetical protein NY202_05885 [Mollicutes bacterium UO1]
MVNEINIPKDNIPKVEEVRYLENTEQQQEPIMESVKEAVLPVAHASDDEEVKEGLQEAESGAIASGGAIVGTATLNPVTGAAAGGTIAASLKGLGKIERGIGKIIDSEALKGMGEVHDEGSTKALEEVGKKIMGK